MKSKILILGKGFIGQRLHQILRYPVTTARIHSFKDIDSILKRHKPRTLINCIGVTGRETVDDCESILDKTLSANTFVPVILAEAAIRHNIKLVHISSGCIYHFSYKAQRPITEQLVPDYYDLYYSRTKIYAENILNQLSKNNNILIVRVRIPLDNQPHPRNLLTKLIKYQSIINIPNSVTYIPDFAKALHYLIQKDARGIFNVVCKGALRYKDLLNEYKFYIPDYRFSMISMKSLKLNRTNLKLSTAKLEQNGFKVKLINNVIKECVKEYVKS